MWVCVIRLVFRGKTGFVFLVVKRFEESVVYVRLKWKIRVGIDKVPDWVRFINAFTMFATILENVTHDCQVVRYAISVQFSITQSSTAHFRAA